MTDILFLIGRVFYGGYFILYGLRLFRYSAHTAERLHGKRIPFAQVLTYLAALLLPIGGLGILLGLYVNVSLTIIVVVLLFMSFTVHDYWNQSDPKVIAGEMSQFTRNLALLGAALIMYSILQPWSYSF